MQARIYKTETPLFAKEDEGTEQTARVLSLRMITL